jgi:Zn-finger nucleic acid-binding protein
VASEPATTISCPRCGQVLEERRYGRERVETCAVCSGVLAGQATIARLVPNSDRLWTKFPNQEAAQIRCPMCGEPMTAILIAGVELDRCDDDFVIWFDRVELAKLEPAEPSDRSRGTGVGGFVHALVLLLDILSP